MAKLNGIHHLAVSTADMKGQIEFFTDVLGMRLVALYWMHGAEGCWHGFLELNDHCTFALVFNPANEKAKPEIGVTHAGNGAGASSPGTMQHISFNVATQEDLYAMRDRIRSRGINVIGPIPHGMCDSIYFAGPENLVLEVAISEQPINAEAWIDPEVVELAGISAEELAKFKSPAPYTGEKGVKQPPYDPSKPHPKGMKDYQQALMIPDEVLFEMTKPQAAPPVKV